MISEMFAELYCYRMFPGTMLLAQAVLLMFPDEE